VTRRRRFLWILFVVIGLVVIVEISLRLVGFWYLASFYRELDAASRMQGSINIVCLGESTTAGLWVKFEDSYPKQLERALREFYRTNAINVIVPPHIGQNTSQIANRIHHYLERYRPRLLIVMAGANNEWSLAESNITLFLDKHTLGVSALKIRLIVLLDTLRTFKVLRHGYSALSAWVSHDHVTQNWGSVLGHPEYSRFPPDFSVWKFARDHPAPFVDLWRHDVRVIIRTAKANDVKVLLMTYPLNPAYLRQPTEWDRLAREEDVPLLRNDVIFRELARQGTLDQYLKQDHWHPNERGYRLVTGNVFDFITRLDTLELAHPRGARLRPAAPTSP
jgi:lysophospholipase L1-like esterase